MEILLQISLQNDIQFLSVKWYETVTIAVQIGVLRGTTLYIDPTMVLRVAFVFMISIV